MTTDKESTSIAAYERVLSRELYKNASSSEYRTFRRARLRDKLGDEGVADKPVCV
jgi:hypothetical protein